MLYCIISAYASVYLLSKGCSSGEAGLVLAIGYALGLPLQIMCATVADKRPYGPGGVLAVGIIVTLVLVCLQLFVHGGQLLICSIFVILIAVVMGVQPLINSYAFYLERFGTPINYGLGRSIGSLSYALVSAFLGFGVVWLNEQAVPGTGLFLALGLMVVLFLLHREGVPPATDSLTESPSEISASQDGGKRNFLFLLIGTIFLFISHGVFLNFTIQIVNNIGGNSADMGILCAYTAVIELPVMLLFERMRRKFSCVAMLKLAAVFFVLKNVLLLATRSMLGLYVGLLTHALDYPLFVPAAVRYTGLAADEKHTNRAEALLTAAMTLGNVCASMVGGFLIQHGGVKMCLFYASISALLGACFVLFGMKRVSFNL